MIKNKQELIFYLEQDMIALGKEKRCILNKDEIWKFEILLRKCEYYHNIKKNFIQLIVYKIILFKFNKMSLKLNFTIPLNVFGPGLSIAHYGTIVVNSKAKVDKNCRIHESTNIGATNGSSKAPNIGDNVFIGTGAKIIGDIYVADDVAIGANAVVVKDINTPGITVGGIPAKKISDNNSHQNLKKKIFELKEN